MTDRLTPQREAENRERTPKRAAALTAWIDKFSPIDGQRAVENAETVLEEDVPALLAELAAVRAERDQAQARVEELEDRNGCLLDQQAKDDAEFAEALAERDRYRLAWQSASFRAEARGEGILRIVKDREAYQKWLEQEQAATQQLRTRVAELEALTPAPIQTCRVCSAGYTYGQPCSACEFNKRMARETGNPATTNLSAEEAL
ncbi:hypothetical protein ACFVAF_25610 [Streptomyces sp. NPDC057596]|uniref:hypothetical protein n=1 Tax=Streptomyces sp. NPDC057596 TaxID=3346178 RepID=UPI0036B9C65B